MNENIVAEEIRCSLKNKHLDKKLFLIDKETLDIIYNSLDNGQTFLNCTSPSYVKEHHNDFYNILRSCRGLATSIYYQRQEEISSAIYYIDDIFRKLHPSNKIDLNSLKDDLKMAYLEYIRRIHNLLDFIDDTILHNTEKYFNIKLADLTGAKTYNKFGEKIICRSRETKDHVEFNIDINGLIDIIFLNSEKKYLFNSINNPFKEFERDTKDLFLKDMNEFNYQKIIDKIDDKRFLFEQTEIVSQEATKIKFTLNVFIKHGINITEKITKLSKSPNC